MEENKLNLTEQYIQNRERIKRRNKVIFIIVICLIFTAVIAGLGYKKYKAVQQQEEIYDNQVRNINHRLMWQFEEFLDQVCNISIKMLFNQEYEKEDMKVVLMKDREKIDNLRYITCKQEFRIDYFDEDGITQFLQQSSYCLYELMGQKQVSSEQKEYLASIYNVYSRLKDLYNQLNKEYDKACEELGDKGRKRLAYRFFNEGEFLYKYVNQAYGIIDGVEAEIETESSIENEVQRQKFNAERTKELQNAISKSEARVYAEDMYYVLFGKRDELTEIGVTSETYDMEEGIGSIYDNEDGMYLIGTKYSAGSFDGDEQYIFVNLVNKLQQYIDIREKVGDRLDEKELDKIADDIIGRLKCKLISRVSRKERLINGSDKQVLVEYAYNIKDDSFVDKSAYVYLQIYQNGTVRQFDMTNNEILYGTYKKPEAKITVEQAVQSIEPEFQNDIIDWVLVYNGENSINYEFTVDVFDNKFNIVVDAISGEVIYIAGK